MGRIGWFYLYNRKEGGHDAHGVPLGEAARYPNYLRAVEAAGGQVRCSTDLARAMDCDALLLPGGGDLEPWRYGQPNTASRGLEPDRDAAEFALLDRFTAAGKPILGICRGLQTINVFFGGALKQDISGHSGVNGVDRLHEVWTEPSFLRDLYGARSVVNSAHHQAVDRPGEGLRVVQRTPDGTAEALCHKTLPVWAVQWHPERLSDVTDGGAVFRAFLVLCR